MERLLRWAADHRLTSKFEFAWMAESVKGAFDSELLPGEKSPVFFTRPQSTMNASSVTMVIPGSLGIKRSLTTSEVP